MSAEACLGDIVEITMGQSPAGEKCNLIGRGLPLLNGPTEFGSKHPRPVQFTTDPKKTARLGDLLFCVRGSTTGRMNWADQTYAIGRGIASIRGKNGYPNSFIRAAIESNLDSLLIQATGSTFPNVSRELISSLVITKVTPEIAKVIASIIEPLDYRIALLRETNTTLEAIAQALFKSWFVDFDPVRAKQEGREPEGMDADTAALFPDSFEESELGLVPKGWRVGKVEDLLVLAYGKALKASERLSGTIPVYGSGGITGCHNEPLVNGPSIVVGRKGTVGSLYWIDQPFYPIDTVFYVKANVPLSYCYYQLALLGLEGMNTDAAVPGLNRNNVYRLSVVIPFNSVIEKFDSFVTLLRRRIFSNVVQSQTLASIRDTLLPRLISGQLRLPEAEAIIEEATA